MPARARPKARRWTRTKSHGERMAPHGAAWDGMVQKGSFTLTNEDGDELRVKLNDVAAICPQGMSPEEDMALDQYWMGKVHDIRSTPDGKVRFQWKDGTVGSYSSATSRQVWVQINWYYSPRDINEKIQTFNPSHCAKQERIYSHHSDIVSAFTFNDIVRMVDFLEDDPQQAPILRDAFFCRYFFDAYPSALAVHQYTLCDVHGASNARKTLEMSTCIICDEPYNPDDSDPDRVMHWCPRLQCCRGYHRGCLIDNACHGVSASRDAVIRARLANTADTDTLFVLPDTRTMSSVIPAQLMHLAAQPIMRGGTHGVAGNVAAVVRARRVVHIALQKHGYISGDKISRNNLPSGSDSKSRLIMDAEPRHIVDAVYGLDLDLHCWDEDSGFAGWEDAIVEEEEDELCRLVCPECGRAI
ncbi:hypothetical protein GGX14DRAFT_518118 [Mycena pura]|uniref:BAH domain-containing protein n=1 Tax=Mycena pura TaxID=153505 RepID=A0AAD6VLF0_9AGAR|nr:hypothetical protein GGX14DRAFT_518118 [Mycena pura]